jgi:hypothetical protein
MKKILLALLVASGATNALAQTELPFTYSLNGCMLANANSCFEIIKQTQLQFGGYICVYENAYGERKVYKSSFQECPQKITAN